MTQSGHRRVAFAAMRLMRAAGPRGTAGPMCGCVRCGQQTDAKAF